MKVNQIKEVFRKVIRNEPLTESEWKVYAQNLTNEQVKTEDDSEIKITIIFSKDFYELSTRFSSSYFLGHVLKLPLHWGD